jgi:two-component system sensor histidine kinase HydH
VRGVTASFNQVLSSLFENAVTAMTAGGELRIASAPAKSGEGIAVTIADTGPGPSGDLIEKALKPFYTTKPGGTGLGLPLARQIMHRHGGELSLSGGKRGLTVSLIFAAA